MAYTVELRDGGVMVCGYTYASYAYILYNIHAVEWRDAHYIGDAIRIEEDRCIYDDA